MTWFDWIQTPSVQAAAEAVLGGGQLSQTEAQRILQDLWNESEVHLRKVVGGEFYDRFLPTQRHGARWHTGNPIGVVDHYTAGVTLHGPVKWFSNMPRNGNSSAHAIIARDGQILLMVDPLRHVAWHAVGANKTHIGIEQVNAGLLHRSGEELFYQGTRPYPAGRYENVQKVEDGYWEPFTTSQIVANIVFKRLCIMAIPTLVRAAFTEHRKIEPIRKIDCGPLFPLTSINNLAFSGADINQLRALQTSIMSRNVLAVLHNEVRELS